MGARDAIAREHPEFREVQHRIAERFFACGRRKDRITIHRRMGRANGARKAILCHDGQTLGLWLRELGIGDDDADGGRGLGGMALDAKREDIGRLLAGQPRPPNSPFRS